MSISFRLLQTVRGCDLFDGRLEEFGVREDVNPRQTSEKERCLTDGYNYLWVFMDDHGFVSSLTRWMTNGDPTAILDAIAVTLDTGIVSEHQPQYWGFQTQWECDEAFKKFSRDESKRERQFERELSKYLRGESNKLEPGTSEMRKAEIAQKLVEKDPSLLLPENKELFAKVGDGMKG